MADESKTGILGHLPPLPRPALNNSVIGMEQAYRQRKGLPLLTDADIEALKAGQPMPWEEGGAAPAASPPSSCGGKFRSCSSTSLPHRRPRHLRCDCGRHQPRSCEVGCGRQEVEQIHHRRRAGSPRTQGFARAEQRGNVCSAGRAS